MNATVIGNCPALRLASARKVQRVPFHVGPCLVGTVARANLPALQSWPQDLAVTSDGVGLQVPAEQRNRVLGRINAKLRCQGLVTAWRDESVDLVDPDTGTSLAHVERAAARFWGTLTLGAHLNAYLAEAGGRPTHLWIARRSPTKATDPGLLDNVVGGGVLQGESPREALVREGFEEAGLSPAQLQTASFAGVLRLHRDIPEGLQLEDLHAFDLSLPLGWLPANQDGEVAGFTCMPVADALSLAATAGMTVDAALVTLDFGARHGLLAPVDALALQAALAPLRRGG